MSNINSLPVQERPGGGLRTLMLNLQEEVRKMHEYANGEVWMKSDEVCEHYGITFPTLKYWYDQGKIGRSQVGSIIRYKKKELDAFFEANYNRKTLNINQ